MEGFRNIKNISLNLGYDVKEELAHISMEKPCSHNMKYDDICKEIDKLMIDINKQVIIKTVIIKKPPNFY